MATPYQLDPGEAIVQRINRSIFDVIPVIIAGVAILVVTAVGLAAFTRFRDQVAFIPTNLVYGLAGTLVIVVVLMLLSAAYVYAHNYLLITNIHVIKLEQTGLFGQETGQLGLSRVQDVSGKRRGILGTIFNYGDVEIETAGPQENFIFRNAPAPQQLADQLLQAHEDYLRDHPVREIP